MTEDFNYLFQYLEKEAIDVDKTEFLFQIQSHPDYPSILAIADALTFFDIQNGVIRVDVSDVEFLPNRFLCFLNNENHGSKFALLEKKGDAYYFNYDKKVLEMSKSALESRWNGVVLLIEKEETVNSNNAKKNNFFWILPSFCLGLFLSILFLFEEKLQTKLFFIFPIVGVLFSIAALKDLFRTQSELISNFCNIAATTSCSTIIGSKKWKIFSFIDLSSLSIVFYTTQLVTLFAFILSNIVAEYFYIQKILLFCAVPVVLLSIYYQKFVEKKWCPICLAIVSILFLELGVLLSFQENSLSISLKTMVLFGFVFFTIAFVWVVLKKMLNNQKELKEFQLTGNRFMRNYEVFKNSLVSNDRIDLPNSPIVLGNNESDTEITFITNPFCGHCKNAHKILEKILVKNHDNLKIKVLFNIDVDASDEETKKFVRCLMTIYFDEGQDFFIEALNYWFETKNLIDWMKIYDFPCDNEKIDSIYRLQNQWCKNSDFNFTPAIFINGYQYPKMYDRDSLELFVNELIQDNFFELA